MAKNTSCGVQLRIRGKVQGVGFRPFVWQLAQQLNLHGDVCNDGDGVEVRLREDPETFLVQLYQHCPPLARIDSVEREPFIWSQLPTEFTIRQSTGGTMNTQIVPDAATCPACLAEMNTPGERRYRYPFINCTHCGPRFTIIRAMPYDRPFTVMAGLYKSLKVEDYRRESANRDTAPRPLGLQDRLSWKKRLSRLMNYPGTRYTKQMMETVCYPAMEEVAQELRLRGAYVELKSLPPEEGQQLGHLDLLVHMGEEQNFVYQIWPQQYSVPGFTYRARSGKSTYYRLETFLLEGSQGNDLMDYSKEQVITDILDQYERHLNFIHLHREAPGHSVMFPDA